MSAFLDRPGWAQGSSARIRSGRPTQARRGSSQCFGNDSPEAPPPLPPMPGKSPQAGRSANQASSDQLRARFCENSRAELRSAEGQCACSFQQLARGARLNCAQLGFAKICTAPLSRHPRAKAECHILALHSYHFPPSLPSFPCRKGSFLFSLSFLLSFVLSFMGPLSISLGTASGKPAEEHLDGKGKKYLVLCGEQQKFCCLERSPSS